MGEPASPQIVLLEAQFNPKLKTYWVAEQLIVLAWTIIGIPLIPFWIPIGWKLCSKRFASLKCKLTDTSLIVKKGHLFRTERTIPLDKIQDLSLRTGPLLNYLGLCKLRVETAGQNSAGGSEADLTGLVNPEVFRDRVLMQRDTVASQQAHSHQSIQAGMTQETIEQLLRDIRDSLRHIQRHLEDSSKGPDGA
jgi:membrane protein YdbS with pleckstrin-like domain